MGFIIHFYIIFGTNLLTGGPVPVAVFLPISVFCRKGISTGIQTEWNLHEDLFLEQTQSRRLGVDVKEATRRPRGRAARPGVQARPHPRGPLVALLTDLFRLYILIYPGNIRTGAKNPISTAATFCTREIPSWGLFRRSARGGINHRGLLHQHHGLSDDVWVVYHRPSGP